MVDVENQANHYQHRKKKPFSPEEFFNGLKYTHGALVFWWGQLFFGESLVIPFQK